MCVCVCVCACACVRVCVCVCVCVRSSGICTHTILLSDQTARKDNTIKVTDLVTGYLRKVWFYWVICGTRRVRTTQRFVHLAFQDFVFSRLCSCAYMCVCAWACMCVCMHVSIYVVVFACACVCAHVCMCTSMYVCVCERMCVCLCVYV